MATADIVLSYEFKPDAKMLHCFNITAVDDEDVESTSEYHSIVLKTGNHLDQVDINITIIRVVDNDGKLSQVM